MYLESFRKKRKVIDMPEQDDIPAVMRKATAKRMAKVRKIIEKNGGTCSGTKQYGFHEAFNSEREMVERITGRPFQE